MYAAHLDRSVTEVPGQMTATNSTNAQATAGS
jgi:hypothetical protein